MPNPRKNGHLSDQVHQATGMISVQAHCDVAEALKRLRLRATAMDQTLEHTAVNVIEGVIRFDQ